MVSAMTGAHLRVLVVDDVRSNRVLLIHVLRRKCKQWEFTEATNGVMALTKLGVLAGEGGRGAVSTAKGHRFDLVLMDKEMPEMDGHQAAARLKEKGITKHTVVLGVSGNTLTEEREEFVRHGVHGVVNKPVDLDSLLRLTATVLLSEMPARAAEIRQS